MWKKVQFIKSYVIISVRFLMLLNMRRNIVIIEIKSTLLEIINKVFGELNIKSAPILERPKDRTMGDVAIPCFSYAQEKRQSPNLIAQAIKEKLTGELLAEVEAIGGYVNLFLNKEKVTNDVLRSIFTEQENYGSQKMGEGKTVVLDYSSPNIAKPFGVGHLRSTVIGNAIRKILDKLGYTTVGINHLGDYGTQFGKIIWAYKKWGNEEAIKANPIEELSKLYVMFHDQAEYDPTLEDEARAWFKKLEDKDEEATKLWEWVRAESLKEFMKTYELLGITDFDSYHGEAFYIDKMQPVIDELEAKNLLVEDAGAQIVKLEEGTPVLITRSDGGSLYITRDLAAIFYRHRTYNFDEILYVIGNEQTLHVKQLKAVVAKMGYDWHKNVHHIGFGMILQGGKKMSTRRGKVVQLHDVLEQAIELAENYITDKNNQLEDKHKISQQIGVGAVIFNDLKNYRTNDIDFNLEDILKFEGETGPYIQYTYARINSIINQYKDIDFIVKKDYINEYIWNIIMQLVNFDEIIVNARNHYDPSLIAKYMIDLAQDYNKFYAQERVITEDIKETNFKLFLSQATAIVLKEGMRLLGISMPKKM